MESVGLGIVGCGVIGRKHLEMAAGLAGVAVVAVADVAPSAVEAAAARFNVPAAYTDADALFADPAVEGVVLALPAYSRTDLGVRAFAAGKHVLTEKPVGMRAVDVRRLIAARAGRVGACCSSRMRFSPSAMAAARVIAAGALGEVRVVRCRATLAAGPPPEVPPPPWRVSTALNGGGILMNWGPYDFDYLLGLLDWSLAPQTVLAQTWQVSPVFADRVAPGSDAETHIAALIRCAGGATITYERGEFVAGTSSTLWEITGTLGTLHLRMTPGRAQLLVQDVADPTGVATRTVWEGDDTYDTGHLGVLRDFARAIRTGTSPKTTLEQALLVQEIADAVYASAASGAAVTIGGREQ